MGRLKDIDLVKEEVARVSGGNLEICDHTEYTGNKSTVMFRKLDCGHTFKRIIASVVRLKVFSCPGCEPDRFVRTYEGLRQVLLTIGAELISAPNGCGDRFKVNIKLICGCMQNRQVGALLKNGTKCSQHSEGYRSWQKREFYEEKVMSLPYGSFDIVGIFQNAAREASYRCRSCGHIEVMQYRALIGAGGKCKNCFGSVKSIREEYLAILLSDLGVEFVREKKLGRFKYDFYLPKFNTLVEYDGAQHYLEDGSNIFAQKNFDDEKNLLAKISGFDMIRIGYKESIVNNVLQFLRKFNDYPLLGVDSSESKDRTPCIPG